MLYNLETYGSVSVLPTRSGQIDGQHYTMKHLIFDRHIRIVFGREENEMD
jgi:hypothetical protein